MKRFMLAFLAACFVVLTSIITGLAMVFLISEHGLWIAWPIFGVLFGLLVAIFLRYVDKSV